MNDTELPLKYQRESLLSYPMSPDYFIQICFMFNLRLFSQPTSTFWDHQAVPDFVQDASGKKNIGNPHFFQQFMAVNGSKAGFLLEFPTGDSSSRPSLSRTVTSPEGAWFTLCECSPRSSFCTPWKQQETTAAWRKFHGTPPPFHKLSVCQKIILHVWLLI
jgi:hypothetical protein